MNCIEKIIRANNLRQFIHQVTIESRFRKSLMLERFKSNLEFRNQIIEPSLKFRKGFAKFMIPIALYRRKINPFNAEYYLDMDNKCLTCKSYRE